MQRGIPTELADGNYHIIPNTALKDYIIARLILTKRFINNGELNDAIDCLDDILKDFT